MKICLASLYAGKLGGGIPPVMEAIAESLRAEGVDFTLQVLDREPPSEIEALDLPYPVTVTPERGKPLGFGEHWTQRILDQAPDLIHAHGLWAGISWQTAKAARAEDIPLLISPHGMLSPGALAISPWKKRLAYPFLERPHLITARAFHALNPAEYQDIRRFGCRRPVAVIPNGVTLPEAGESPSGSVPAPRNLVFLGRVHPKKGLEPFLQTWSRLKPTDWRLVVAGPPSETGSHLETWVRAEGLSDAISFVGPVYAEAKTTLLQNADAFVLPSLSEGQPMAVLEAWAHGLPVLMTGACNLPEGFAAGAAVELPLEPGAQAEVLGEFLIRAPEDLETMGRKGRELVARDFTWEAAAEKYLQLYQWMLDQSPRPDFVIEA